jgi:tetratricopeptide (TPR) repeat protein
MDSAVALGWLGSIAIIHGQFTVHDSLARLTANIVARHGSPSDLLARQLRRATVRATVVGDALKARAIADSAFAISPWRSLRPMDRPYLALLEYFASVNDVKHGAEVASEWSRSTPIEYRLRDSLNVLVGRGELALASGSAREALRLFRIANVRDCEVCFYPRLARAFDALNQRDSARVWFERYVDSTDPHIVPADAIELGHTYLRLGELSEARHDARASITWYEKLSALWSTSDAPTLQASVVDMRARVERLRQ